MSCYDCGEPYGSPAFPDLNIETWAWRRISPKGNDGGLLCPSCILRRLDAADIRCKAYFASGPLVAVEEPVWAVLERVLELQALVTGR